MTVESTVATEPSRPVSPVPTLLFCLAPAGATASQFYDAWPRWVGDLVEVVPVDLPGRGRRARLPRPRDFAALIAQLSRATIERADGRPFAVFGHSFGALVAVELARSMTSRGHAPSAVVVSGRDAPGQPRRRSLRELDDDTLFDEVMSWGGVPDEFRRPALRPLLLKGLRADIVLGETRTDERAGDRVPCPVTVFVADDDTLVDAARAHHWSDESDAGPARVHHFTGGHGYLGRGAAVAPVLRDVLRELPGRHLAPTRLGVAS